MIKKWLTLKQAAMLLGVHPSTVRSWSDKSLLLVSRTRDGHRRFERPEAELRASTARRGDIVDPARAVQPALRRAACPGERTH